MKYTDIILRVFQNEVRKAKQASVFNGKVMKLLRVSYFLCIQNPPTTKKPHDVWKRGLELVLPEMLDGTRLNFL